MTEGNPGSTGWAAFEARMRDRRFARCIERATAGLETGTLEEVRDALDEARILCPGAPEIAELDHRISALPSPSSVLLASSVPVQEPPAGWLRVMGAMAILVVLFGLFGFGLAQLYLNTPAALLTDADPATAPDAPGSNRTAAATPAPEVRERALPSTPPAATAPAPADAEPASKLTSAAAVGTTSPPAAVDAPARAESGKRETPSIRREQPVSKPSVTSPRATPPPAAPPPAAPRPAPTLAQRAPESSTPRASEPPRPQPEPSRPVPAATPPSYETPPAVNAVSRPAPVTDPVLPLEAPTLSPSATAPRAVPASMSRADESAQIRTLLSRYETAYNRLDAAAATSVWPGVDRAALDRAFRGLISQRVSLGLCDITVVGDVGGATCAGKARWEPRVGGGLQTADRYWTFNLRKGNDGWRIEQVRVR